MIIDTKMYIIGTKDRPTKFVTFTNEYTEDIGEAAFYMDKKLAEENMNDCDEPELYRLYEADVYIGDL